MFATAKSFIHGLDLSVLARVPRDVDSGVGAVLRQAGVVVEPDSVVRRGDPASLRSKCPADSRLQRLRELTRRDVVERVPLEENVARKTRVLTITSGSSCLKGNPRAVWIDCL